MASTGFFPAVGEYASAVSAFDIYADATTYINYIKAGGTNPVPDSIDGPAVRQKKFTGVTVNTTTTTIAHGLVDENGNPAVPVAVMQLKGPAAGDVMVSTTDPDATNLYLSASATGSYDFVVLY